MRAMSHAVALSLLLSAAACHQEDVVVRTAEGQESAVGRYSTFTVVLPDPKDLEDDGMTGDALQQIAKWLYPVEFADIDTDAIFRDFHSRFLPIPYSGNFWASL